MTDMWVYTVVGTVCVYNKCFSALCMHKTSIWTIIRMEIQVNFYVKWLLSLLIYTNTEMAWWCFVKVSVVIFLGIHSMIFKLLYKVRVFLVCAVQDSMCSWKQKMWHSGILIYFHFFFRMEVFLLVEQACMDNWVMGLHQMNSFHGKF